MAQTIKASVYNVRDLGWEDSLEKEMATHSSPLALKIPWTEELGAGYCPWGCKESGTTERLHLLYLAKVYKSYCVVLYIRTPFLYMVE